MCPLNRFEQMELFGGGSGTMNDPFTQSEADSADFSNGAFFQDPTGNTQFRQNFSANDWYGNFSSYIHTQNRAWYDWIAGEALSSIPGLGQYVDLIDRHVSMAHEYTEAALYDAICHGELSHTGYFYVAIFI